MLSIVEIDKKIKKGTVYTLTVPFEKRELRGKFIEKNFDGYYVFKITNRDTDIDEYLTKTPFNCVLEFN